jgi:hypothetical protein
MSLIIDPEFQALCPPLLPEEREQLAASLLAEGCRDPLVVWLPTEHAWCETCEAEQPIENFFARHPFHEEDADAEYFWLCTTCRMPINEEELEPILLDGHNRYTLCQQHQIPFALHYHGQIESREEAINWIIANQLGRRNLTEEQKSYLRGKRYQSEKRQDGRPEKRSKNDNVSGRTEARLAQEYRVSPATIQNDSKFATALDTLESQVRQDIRETVLRRQDRDQGRIYYRSE